MNVEIGIGKLSWKRFSIASVIAMAASFGAVGNAIAESKSIERESERYDARASCDSKVLPEAGFEIAGPVPGKDGECYWRRTTSSETATTNQKREAVAETKRDQERAERLRKRALDSVRKDYRNAIAAIAKESAVTYDLFLQKVDECGVNTNCVSEILAQQQEAAANFSGMVRDETNLYRETVGSIRAATQDELLHLHEGDGDLAR